MCMICAQRTTADYLNSLDQHLDASGVRPTAANPGAPFWMGLGAVVEGADAAETTATAYSLLVGQSAYGTISSTTDEDWHAVQLVAGQTYEIHLFGVGRSYLNDPYIRLMDAAGSQIDYNDDGFTSFSGTHERDSRLVFTATTTGTYYVEADAFSADTGDYLLSVTPADPAGMIFTVDEIAWQLINNGVEYFSSPEAAAFDVGADNTLTVNLAGLTTEGQYLAEQALLAWTNVTGITFSIVAGAAEITFDDSDTGAYAVPVYSGSTIISSTVNIGLDWLTMFGTTLDSYSFETYIHEIGHALGLGHGGNYNGSASYGVDNYYLNDSLAWSIMSYMNAYDDEFDFGSPGDVNTYVGASLRYIYTPQIADIIAIQHLYGEYTSANLGDTSWGFYGNTGNVAIDNAVLSGALMSMTVYDNGGFDTLNFSNTSANQLISLFSESLSSVLGGVHNLGIARGVLIERAIGGSGSDTIYGDNNYNQLMGGSGADQLYGGGGTDYLYGGLGADLLHGGDGDDYADYSIATAAVRADLLYGGTNSGEAAGDTYTGIENLVGSAYADTLGGNNLENELYGYAGHDALDGRGGNDEFWGDAGNDTLIGGDGNDVLDGGSGADRIDGGTGTDRAAYDFATAAVRVDLLSQGLNLGEAAGDILTLVEVVSGSSFGDTVSGDNLVNTLYGNSGNDALDGRGGTDYLFGGDGNDALVGGAGADVFDGGAGTRDLASYWTAATGLRAVLLAPAGNTGDAAGDTYSGIEDLGGTGFSDVLGGDNGANQILGGNGNDDIDGFGGNDSIYGGDGNDRLIGNVGADLLDGGGGTYDGASYWNASGLRADLAFANTNTGHAAGDIYVGIENLQGSGFNDTLGGDNNANTLGGLAGNDALDGRGGNDTLGGEAGNDTLVGGAGNDVLVGGAGSDVFVFNAALGATNRDVVLDYVVADDTIWLENAVMTGLSAGALAATAFTSGTAATTADHRVIYNSTNGQLLYDADGNGAGAAVLVATLNAGLVMTAGEFVVI